GPAGAHPRAPHRSARGRGTLGTCHRRRRRSLVARESHVRASARGALKRSQGCLAVRANPTPPPPPLARARSGGEHLPCHTNRGESPDLFLYYSPMKVKAAPRAAGVVVFRRTGRGVYLLVLRAYSNWDFPKG